MRVNSLSMEVDYVRNKLFNKIAISNRKYSFGYCINFDPRRWRIAIETDDGTVEIYISFMAFTVVLTNYIKLRKYLRELVR